MSSPAVLPEVSSAITQAAPQQTALPKATLLYLAGKIAPIDWRHHLVDTRSAKFGEDLRMDEWLEGMRYVGPYFIGCDHGCAHGTATHGCGENCMNYGDENSAILNRCLSAIRRCNVVFSWIDSFDCYGTLIELGYAKALGKHIAIAFPSDFYMAIPHAIPGNKPHNKDFRHDLWFAESIASDLLIDVTPFRAFTRFVGNFHQSRIWEGPL